MQKIKYKKDIASYSKSQIQFCDDILSVKYYQKIAAACEDIRAYGIDYIAIGFFNPVMPLPFWISNMPAWSIPYIKKKWYQFDFLNDPKTFYTLGSDYFIQQEINKSKAQNIIYQLSIVFDIFEAFSILKSVGKFDILIIAHTDKPIDKPTQFYTNNHHNVLLFISIFLQRIKDLLIGHIPTLKYEKILWSQESLFEFLKSRSKYNQLTHKEIETLFCAGLGLTYEQVARKLGVSGKSVKKSLDKAREKLQCNNTYQAISKANTLGLLMPTIKEEVSMPYEELSPRESQAVYWTAQGYSAKEIARIMAISPRTVEIYLNSSLEKLGCSNKRQLVLFCHLTGLLTKDIMKFSFCS